MKKKKLKRQTKTMESKQAFEPMNFREIFKVMHESLILWENLDSQYRVALIIGGVYREMKKLLYQLPKKIALPKQDKVHLKGEQEKSTFYP